jgi:uncharacterized repeat protein (TIGR04076 family)
MADKNEVKITVVKKIDSKDIYGKKMPETPADFKTTCPLWEEGREFIVASDGKMPQDFCSWAWHDIHRDLCVVRYGGKYPWLAQSGLAYACCSDGLRPVIFKIEKVK